MAKWKKEIYKLKDKHRWEAKPGYKIFVANRGAVRFDFPQDWVIHPDAQSIKLHDREPPDDDCRLEVSFNLLPPIDWSGLPLPQLLRDSLKGDERDLVPVGEVVNINRRDLRLAWAEYSFTDPIENRPAYTRVLLGIGGNVQCLITFDFWADDAPRLAPVWDEVVRSLKLGVPIQDPTTGEERRPHLN